MPQVSPTPQLAFTNHWIGIYAKGKNLVPVRRTGKPVPRPASPAVNAVAAPNDPSTLTPLYERVLADRVKELGPGHAQVARSAAGLGLFLKAIHNPVAAEGPLRAALSIDQANTDPMLPADQQNLAMVLDAAGKRAEAVALFRHAAGGGNPAVAARSWASLAALDPERAPEYYRQALEAEEIASGPNHRRVAILLNNLAMAQGPNSGGKSAEPLLRRALAIQQKTPGARHVETAATLINLGSVLQDQKQFAEAERVDRLAISILEEKSPESRELATACTNLADLWSAKGDRLAAEQLYRRALFLDESIYGADDPEVAGDLTSLGVLLQEKGDFAAAGALLRRALGIYEKTLGPNSPQALDIRENLRRQRK
jgi:tetratricopeptide (TPR) repeat protein